MAEGGDGASVVPPDAAAAAFQARDADRTGSLAATASSAERVNAAPEISENLAVSSTQAGNRSRISDSVRASALQPLIQRYAATHELPYSLADAVVRIESRYNAAARNGPNLGLTQVSFTTARSLGYTGTASGLFDAETNLRYGLKYLGQAYKLAKGDTCGTVLRYQAGHRAATMTNAARIYCQKVKTHIAAAD
jgi:soluble lytic murein transglycosylase-like protein